VTKTCLQCGAVLPSSVRACNFCEVASVVEPVHAGAADSVRTVSTLNSENDSAWRDELVHRLESYRGRKKKTPPHAAQTRLPFEVMSPAVSDAPRETRRVMARAAVAGLATLGSEIYPDRAVSVREEFSFTIAIGRPPKKCDEDARMIIDVSLPPEKSGEPGAAVLDPGTGASQGLLPVASIDERRLAAVVDGGCLLFAYGAFLALFGALGGEFTASKLSGEVCIATFAIVYLQYFALFTIFGGTTPGMMLRGLQVVSFTGEPPTPRQMLLRSAGYVLSAGTFFLGFVWSLWDEDTLTWHDRISRTYLSAVEAYTDVKAAEAAPIR
jgi:uncharacterized RDD family membrane protein YckC